MYIPQIYNTVHTELIKTCREYMKIENEGKWNPNFYCTLSNSKEKMTYLCLNVLHVAVLLEVHVLVTGPAEHCLFHILLTPPCSPLYLKNELIPVQKESPLWKWSWQHFITQHTQKKTTLTLSCDDWDLESGWLALFFSSVVINELQMKTKQWAIRQKKTCPYIIFKWDISVVLNIRWNMIYIYI